LIIFAIIIYSGKSSSCPSCKKWWSKKFVDKQIANKESFYKTIIRKDVTKNRSGKVISTTERPEQVHMIKVTYDNYYICSKCSYKWTEQTKEEYEG